MAEVLSEQILGDRYEILSEVGRGQLGVVYKGRHIMMDRVVAIKVLFQDLSGDETQALRFQREAKSAGRLSHPNIITVFDFGISASKCPYLVMDYLEGRSLHDVLSREIRLSLDRAFPIFIQVCSALAHAHRRGVLHRDLKPSNTMLVETDDDPEFVKIVDFGIAKQLGDEESIEKLTLDGQICGTPGYMSPEQCLGKPLDVRSDVYSMGCLMFKSLTGITPIPGNTPLEVVAHQVSEDPLDFKTACPEAEIPKEIQAVIFKALKKGPEERPQTMRDLRTELRTAFERYSSRGQFFSYRQLEHVAQDSARELHRLSISAEAGNAGAKYELGKRYYDGIGIERNADMAIKLFAEAAQQEDTDAQVALAEILMSGKEVPENFQGAFQLLCRAREQSHPRAMDLLGGFYESGEHVAKDMAQAFELYRAAAEAGNSSGEFNFGRCLLHGIGARKDQKEGLRWLTRAAHGGNAKARHLLGQAYLEGLGVDKNNESAVQWFRQAAQQGLPEAQFSLGLCYENGTGVNQDFTLAIEWLLQAAEAGEPKAQWRVGFHKLTGEATKQDEEDALRWFQLSAKQGYDMAQASLGDCYRDGRGVQRDLTQAIEWYQRAAAGDNPNAMCSLADCLLEQNGGVQNSETIAWYSKSADYGSPRAMFMLGKALLRGDGIKHDNWLAEKWLRVALKKGIQEAQPLLTECYQHEMQVNDDPDKRQKLLVKAASLGNADSQRELAQTLLEKEPNKREEALDLLRKASEQGDALAMFELYKQRFGEDQQDAIHWLQLAADVGLLEAQLEFATCYEEGRGVQQDQKSFRNWLERAAEQNNAQAQARLGFSLIDQKEPSSKAEGWNWLLCAAKQGVVAAQSRVGLCFEKGEGCPVNLEHASHWFQAAVRNGDRSVKPNLDACNRKLFEMGNRSTDVIEWLAEEAQKGELDSMAWYGDLMREQGNLCDSYLWYRRAAEEGHAAAQYHVGWMLRTGEGVGADKADAMTWLTRAAEQQVPAAMVVLAVAYVNGEGVAPDAARAVQILQEAADKGNKEAQAQLGALMIVGEGVRLSPMNGIPLLRDCAERGSSFAQWKLALCYKHGLGVSKDLHESERWFAQSAENYFDQGLPWPCNSNSFRFEAAVKIFQTMADTSHKQAQHWLGICCEKGIGIPRDLGKAIQLYRSSAARGYAPAQQELTRLGQ